MQASLSPAQSAPPPRAPAPLTANPARSPGQTVWLLALWLAGPGNLPLWQRMLSGGEVRWTAFLGLGLMILGGPAVAAGGAAPAAAGRLPAGGDGGPEQPLHVAVRCRDRQHHVGQRLAHRCARGAGSAVVVAGGQPAAGGGTTAVVVVAPAGGDGPRGFAAAAQWFGRGGRPGVGGGRGAAELPGPRLTDAQPEGAALHDQSPEHGVRRGSTGRAAAARAGAHADAGR